MIAPLALLAGAASWTATEYALHRFIGHGARRHRRAGLARLTPAGFLAEFNEEHIAHHANPSYFAPTSTKVAVAAAVLVSVGAVGSALVGPRRALSYALGFASAYLGYEVLHRRIHTHGPTGRYSRWMRKHHLYHHHRSPRANHGVTSPLWDRALGTEQPAERVKIPAWMAPPWLVDAQGAVRPELRDDYELAGSKKQRPEHASPVLA